MRHQNGEGADWALVCRLRSKLSSPFWWRTQGHFTSHQQRSILFLNFLWFLGSSFDKSKSSQLSRPLCRSCYQPGELWILLLHWFAEMKMIGKKQGKVKFCLLIFLECLDKKGFLGETSAKLNVWLRQSVVDTYRALWQHSKFLQIWGLKCAKQLKYQHEWPWASFGATYRHQLVLQSSTSSLKIPCWSVDNNLAHNPSDQDWVQCTKAGESSLDFFSRFNLLATSFTLLELVKLDLPLIIALLP